jgi:hypothetical protein
MAVDSINDDLLNTKWLGEVIDNEDPLKKGRCRIRVYGKMDMRVDPYDDASPYVIPDENLPWASLTTAFGAGSATGSGQFSVPKIGSVVSVTFDNGNPYYPEYSFHQHISDEFKAEIENSYTNSHGIIYDTITEGGLKVFFTEEKGLMLDYKETQINIKPDNSVNILNPNGDTIILTNDGNLTIKTSAKVKVDSPAIELGAQATEAVIKGNTFQQLFNAHTHIGNLGAPTSTPIVPLTGSELSTTTKTQ